MPGCAGITHSRTPTGPEAGNLGSPGVPPGPASLRGDSQRGDQPSCFRMALCHEGPRLGRRQAALHVSPLRGKGLAQHERHPVAGKACGRLTAASAHLLWQSQATAGFLPLGGFVVMPRPTSPAAQSPGCASHSSGCRWLILDSYGAKCSFCSHWTSRPPGQWPFSAPCEIRSQPGSPCI